jgi:hypothetical protein
MASTWGDSWGESWGDSWGEISLGLAEEPSLGLAPAKPPAVDFVIPSGVDIFPIYYEKLPSRVKPKKSEIEQIGELVSLYGKWRGQPMELRNV